MEPDIEIAGDKYFSRECLAKELRLSKQTLACWSSRGIGPKKSKIGRHILYHLEAVRKFLKEAEKD
jgi:hypothetical protein